MSKLNDGLPQEQLSNRDVEVEEVGGGTKRQRVSGQTVFDKMLLEELIDVSQWLAVHLFIEDLSTSGAAIPSMDFEAAFEANQNNPVNISDRRMIFSSAFRSMDKCGEENIRIFMRACELPFGFRTKTHKELEKLSRFIIQNLSCLSKHYGVKLRTDPRVIIRRQIHFG